MSAYCFSLPRLVLLVTACTGWLLPPTLSAHPGVGLVRDSRGVIYYTDLVHVWMITPDQNGKPGRKQIAVRHVHTHELALDGQDNLYGEDLQYEGEAIDRWHHRIWKRLPSGRVTDLFGQRAGFRQDYGFVSDRRGTQYWLYYEGEISRIYRKDRAGRITTITPAQPLAPHLNWLAIGADGVSLYITANTALYRVRVTGETETVLHGMSQSFLMGMWPGSNGSVLVADFGGKTIQEVDRQGHSRTVATVRTPWAPTSVLRDPANALWILEYSTTNQARVRRVDSRGNERVF